jgi:hypothetical protein
MHSILKVLGYIGRGIGYAVGTVIIIVCFFGSIIVAHMIFGSLAGFIIS